MQDEIYKKMTAKGWYPTEQADQQKISQAEAKICCTSVKKYINNDKMHFLLIR